MTSLLRLVELFSGSKGLVRVFVNLLEIDHCVARSTYMFCKHHFERDDLKAGFWSYLVDQDKIKDMQMSSAQKMLCDLLGIS